MEANPYQAPITPSDQMTDSSSSELLTSSAYRTGSVFYCEPDFESPHVCFKTGVVVPEVFEKSRLWSKSTNVELYFDLHYLKELGRKQRMKVLLVVLMASVSTYLAVVYSSYFFLVPVVAMLILVIKPAKEKSIQIDGLSNGFYAIYGAHPDFLELFPEKAE